MARGLYFLKMMVRIAACRCAFIYTFRIAYLLKMCNLAVSITFYRRPRPSIQTVRMHHRYMQPNLHLTWLVPVTYARRLQSAVVKPIQLLFAVR